jgi:site-specific DNA recombinase
MQAVIYVRVSSERQEEEGFSIDAQLELLRKYAASQGFDVVKEFIDVQTAKFAGRLNFAKMLEEVGPGIIILVEKTDRLYRNFRDYVTVDELLGKGVEVHLVKEGEILSAGSNSHSKFIHGIKVLMAKNYIDNLSEETKKGQFQKIK